MREDCFSETPKPAGKMPTLPGNINFGALLSELGGFFFKSTFNRIFFRQTLLGGVLPHVLGDLHRAEVRTAHGTEVRGLGAFLRQRLMVLGACLVLPMVGVTVSAPLIAVRHYPDMDQIDAQLPWEIQPPTAQVIVKRGLIATPPTTIPGRWASPSPSGR